MMVTGQAEGSGIWAVVPLKSLRGSKKRLADLLGDDERKALVTALFRDVLAALSMSPDVGGIMVVTGVEAVAEIALEYDARVVPEGKRPGLSEAVASAARILTNDKVERMMVVHGDLPLATPADFELLLKSAAGSPAVTIVPCRNEDGSNVMVCSPPDVIPFCYGPGSFGDHQQVARDAGIDTKIGRIPGLALDIDTPEDLACLLKHYEKGEAGPATAQVLSGLDLSSRLN